MADQKQHPTLILWDEFNRWFMIPEMGEQIEPDISFSLLMGLYKPAITPQIFWERCGNVMAAYRELPGAMHHLYAELERLRTKPGFLWQTNVSLSNQATVPDFYLEFLRTIRWHRSSNWMTEERIGAELIMTMVGTWEDMFFDAAEPDIHDRHLFLALLFWQRMRRAVKDGNARLVDGTLYQKKTRR